MVSKWKLLEHIEMESMRTQYVIVRHSDFDLLFVFFLLLFSESNWELLPNSYWFRTIWLVAKS